MNGCEKLSEPMWILQVQEDGSKKYVWNEACFCPPPMTLVNDGAIDISGEISPGEGWEALFDGLSAEIVAAIEAQTEAITDMLQAICDKLEAGITVNAVQSGEWTVEIGDASIDSIIEALENADLSVTIAGQDGVLDVNIVNDTITVTLDQASLDALENITVTIDTSNGPVEVTGTVNIGNEPIEIDWTGLQDALDGLDVEITNFQDLVDLLEDTTLNVTLNGEELNVNFEDVLNALSDLQETIQDIVRVDYERIDHVCILDADNNEIPMTGVFTEKRYSHTGNIISTTTVLSQMNALGVWGSYTLGAGEKVAPCPKEGQEFCVESQEWTYAVDNTGTSFADTATYVMTLSDGSTLSVEQTPTGGWTAQNQLLQTLWQAAADAAGLSWFIEPRTVNNPNPSDISGNYGSTPTGLPGASSVVVAQYLIDNGIVARYLNIQVCPGQPVPVSVVRTESDIYTNNPYILTTAGALQGPLQKFWMCKVCGEAPKWYLEDGVTPASAGQIPSCYEPCGTLTLADNPPDRSIKFETENGCDNLNQSNQSNNKPITRRISISSDGTISIDYFEADPSDPTSLIPYDIVGDFVDCDTGEIVPTPDPACTKFEIVKLYTMETNGDTGLRNREWHDTAPAEPTTAGTDEGRAFREGHDFSLPTTVDSIQNNFTLDDTDNTASELDIQVKEGYISVTSDMLLRYSGSTEGYWAVELGQCEMDLQLLAESGGFFSGREMIFTIPKGIHQIRLWNIDSGGSNSAANLSYSLDGGTTWITDNTPPGIVMSTGKQIERCENIKVCEDNGSFFGLLDGLPKDPANYYDCSLACDSVGSKTNQLLSDFIGDESDTCPCPDDDSLGEPLGDQAACASRKLGADFVSNSTGSATHTAGSLYDTNGPVTAWIGTFTVIDSANVSHTFNDGETVTGLASGSVTSVSFTGEIEWTDGTTVYRCPVNDKLISAGFTVS